MKRVTSIIATVVMATTIPAACGGGSKSESSSATNAAAAGSKSFTGGNMTVVADKDKLLVWCNRQPPNGSANELNKDALHHNDKAYYVGFDTDQGAELQGQTIVDYIKKHTTEIDKNGDGTIGYVPAIRDIGHNDLIARMRDVRKVLGTAVEKDDVIDSMPAGTNIDGTVMAVKDGELEADDKTCKARELASQRMKDAMGATWDTVTASNGINTWASSFGDQIDIVASNNDGMDISMSNAWSKENKVPTFGYDADSDAVAATPEGYGGMTNQRVDVWAYLTPKVLRNLFDDVGVDTDIGTAGEASNALVAVDYEYVPEDRSYYALNLVATADNYQDFADATKAHAPVVNKLDVSKHISKKVWPNTYDATDSSLSSTYKPLLKSYAELPNLNINYVDGDGQTESNITNRLGNPDQYGAFAINMVGTDNAASYTAILNQ